MDGGWKLTVSSGVDKVLALVPGEPAQQLESFVQTHQLSLIEVTRDVGGALPRYSTHPHSCTLISTHINVLIFISDQQKYVSKQAKMLFCKHGNNLDSKISQVKSLRLAHITDDVLDALTQSNNGEYQLHVRLVEHTFVYIAVLAPVTSRDHFEKLANVLHTDQAKLSGVSEAVGQSFPGFVRHQVRNMLHALIETVS